MFPSEIDDRMKETINQWLEEHPEAKQVLDEQYNKTGERSVGVLFLTMTKSDQQLFIPLLKEIVGVVQQNLSEIEQHMIEKQPGTFVFMNMLAELVAERRERRER